MKNILTYVLGGITILTFLIGGAVRFNNVEGKVVSTEKTISQLSDRLDQKILSDNYNALRERLWKMEEEYGNIDKIKDPLIKKELKDLKDEIELQKEKLKERSVPK